MAIADAAGDWYMELRLMARRSLKALRRRLRRALAVRAVRPVSLETAEQGVGRWWHWVVDAETPVAEATDLRAASASEAPSEAERERGTGTFRFDRLRLIVAMAIVIGAVSVAAAAWRAEIFGEYATQKEALFRQDLTGQQLSERSDEQLVTSQLLEFGAYERDATLALQTQAAEGAASGAAARALATEAQNEWTIAGSEATYDFPSLSTNWTSDFRPFAQPQPSYALAILGDGTLSSFAPAYLDSQAHKARADALKMGAVAVLFAITVVLFTLSEMALRRRYVGPTPRWTVGHAVGAAGLLMWLAALGLFVVLYLDVPGLK